MPRAPGPDRMRRDLDRAILRQLEQGHVKRIVAGKVEEVDLPASFLDLVRRRINDLGATKPATPDPVTEEVAKLARKAAPKMPPVDAEFEVAATRQVPTPRPTPRRTARTTATTPAEEMTPAQQAAEIKRLKQEIATANERLAGGGGNGDGDRDDGW